MAHFAEIDSTGKVLRVLVVGDDQEHRGHDFLANDLGLGGTWIQTSYNTFQGRHKLGGTPIRKNYAGPSHTYDAGRDAFIPPQPFPSWVLNEDTCDWDPPVARPAYVEGYVWIWNEPTVSWIQKSYAEAYPGYRPPSQGVQGVQGTQGTQGVQGT
jgi:hypothetical protein